MKMQLSKEVRGINRRSNYSETETRVRGDAGQARANKTKFHPWACDLCASPG